MITIRISIVSCYSGVEYASHETEVLRAYQYSTITSTPHSILTAIYPWLRSSILPEWYQKVQNIRILLLEDLQGGHAEIAVARVQAYLAI